MTTIGEMTLKEKKCDSCGRMFTPKDPRHSICYDCFRQKQSSDERSDSTGRTVMELPEGYLAKGYFDERGFIFPEVITKWPEDMAIKLGKVGVTSAGLRRFYNKSKFIEQRLDAGEPFPSMKAKILELKQHAANVVGKAANREEKAKLELFKKFIDQNVDLAVSDEDGKSFREGFLLHFQGVIAYFKYHYPKK
jgi:CRISPR type III-A-associated protein Csm2